MRAARALLNWSGRQLPKSSGVSHSAIARAEKFDHFPRMQERCLRAIRLTLELHGIEFLDDLGVRLHKETPHPASEDISRRSG
jgi:transcriptional regulator with XRE-family HTH domain